MQIDPGSPVKLHAEHGLEFKSISGRATTFDHDIVLNNKHVSGLYDPVSSSVAVNKEYADSKLALAVNELIRKIYLHADSLTNLQTNMLSRIESQRGEMNSYIEGQIATLITKQTEMLGKIQLNELAIVILHRETNELVDTTKTSIESEYEQRMTNIRSRQEEILENLTAYHFVVLNIVILHRRFNGVQTHPKGIFKFTWKPLNLFRSNLVDKSNI